MKALNQLQKYVPRHFRLGSHIFAELPAFMQDVVESVPVVGDDGIVVDYRPVIKSVPAAEVMSQFQVDKFRLSAMVKAGVPLKVVNVNASNSVTIDRLESICKRIDGADLYVQKVLEQQKERESWFKPVDEVVSDDSKNETDV